MKLTLGQAAKEVGISKPSLSAAIKKGRLSAPKNESGTYEIDPAELFRVYPPKANTNGKTNSGSLTKTNPSQTGGKAVVNESLDLLLAEKDKLIAEKEKAIERLEHEKTQIREDLQDQKDQTKRMTLLLENKPNDRAGDWEASFRALEDRISNQERKAQDDLETVRSKANAQISRYRQKLDAERSKSFWQRLWG